MATEKYKRSDGAIVYCAVWRDKTGKKRKVAVEDAIVPPDRADKVRDHDEAKRKAAAEAARRQKDARYGDGDVSEIKKRPLPFRVLVKHFLEHYEPRRETGKTYYEFRSKVWLRHFKDRLVKEIFWTDIQTFIKAREKEGASPSTIKKDVTSLSTCFAWAKDWYPCQPRLIWEAPTDNPAASKLVRRPTVPRRQNEVFTREKENEYTGKVKDWLARVVRFMANTGFDRKDVVELTWDQIDRNRKVILSARSKTGVYREIPYRLNAPLCELLDEAHKARKLGQDNRVFVGGRGEPLTVDSLRMGLRRMYGKNKVRQPCRIWRHTFKARLLERNVSRDCQRYLMGHGSQNMTDEYGAPDFSRLEEAMRIDAVYWAQNVPEKFPEISEAL